MPTFKSQVLISNQSGYPKGYIVDVVGIDHKFGIPETLASWVASGRLPEDWGRSYTLVKFIDKTREELLYLLEPFVINEISQGRKYSFSEPEKNSPLYNDLYDDGEATVNWSVAEPYLIERI